MGLLLWYHLNKTLVYENTEIEKLQNLFDPPTVVGDELTFNNKIESTIVKEILKDENLPPDVDDSDIPIAKTTEETEQENIIQNSLVLERPNLKKTKEILKL